jgi:hypothetical protein
LAAINTTCLPNAAAATQGDALEVDPEMIEQMEEEFDRWVSVM